MPRISVIGTSGSGKTTLARELSDRLNIPHIELDALHWGPNWTPTPAEALRPRVAAAVAGESWTTCGNYGAIRDVIWSRADTIIWLDYSMSTVLWQIIRKVFTSSCSPENRSSSGC
jgi:adenylate kinase family enzyme